MDLEVGWTKPLSALFPAQQRRGRQKLPNLRWAGHSREKQRNTPGRLAGETFVLLAEPEQQNPVLQDCFEHRVPCGP